ncbi:MAG: serine/threonine phosphatase, partial [Coleofasciculaceae cyanobacterium]
MLICPLCSFENPNNNNFCQKCGTSLSHKTCPECDAQVPINAETCQSCGTYTGTVWQAIIKKEPIAVSTSQIPVSLSEDSSAAISLDQAEELPIEVADTDEASLQTETTKASSLEVPLVEDSQRPPTAEELMEEDTTQPLSSPASASFADDSGDNLLSAAASTPSAVYLDTEERYRLLEPHSVEEIEAAQTTLYGASVRVLDSQPFQKTLLQTLREQEDDEQQDQKSLNSKAWKDLGIPKSAQAYLSLQRSHYPTLPEVHDAWLQDGVAVILLEDRSQWQILGNLWDSEELSTLQILYWLDEMAKLWEALEPWHCRQSLLEVTNLRVDEDSSLGLLRLYPDPEKELTLQDLGEMWQKLFSQSQRTQFASLGAVYRQLCTEDIKTVAELRSHLEAIAREHQPSPTLDQQPESTEVSEFDLDFTAIGSEGREGAPTVMQKVSPNEANFNNDADDLPTVILPMQLLSLDDAGCTDIGQHRERNEDCFGINTQVQKQENPMGRTVQAKGLYVLCDGMGGHLAGEVASAMAVEKLKEFFEDNWQDDQLPTEETVREAVRVANQAIYDVNQQNARSGSGRMGTTLVMILIQNTEAVIAHVGDSRLYRLTRKRGLEQVTVDH